MDFKKYKIGQKRTFSVEEKNSSVRTQKYFQRELFLNVLRTKLMAWQE